MIEPYRDRLLAGQVIPACPLALDAQRRFDPRRQRALLRYYLDAGAGGVAVGVHTTQFAIRQPRFGLFRPVMELAAEELRGRQPEALRIGGICGPTEQAVGEAGFLVDCGYHAGLLSLGALASASEDELVDHCRQVASVIPIIGFYLQPAVGGRVLPYSFWRRLLQIEQLVALKIAPFNRYQTLEVMRAVAESGRADVALYTGNDDNILLDLLTPYRFVTGKGAAERHLIERHMVERRFVGGLLGQWAVWTRRAVELLAACRQAQQADSVPADLLRLHVELTDANAAIFDAANSFRGCIAGIHEVLRRQGLLEGTWCLESDERLSPGQEQEIERVLLAYPHLNDDAFVRENLDAWLQ